MKLRKLGRAVMLGAALSVGCASSNEFRKRDVGVERQQKSWSQMSELEKKRLLIKRLRKEFKSVGWASLDEIEGCLTEKSPLVLLEFLYENRYSIIGNPNLYINTKEACDSVKSFNR